MRLRKTKQIDKQHILLRLIQDYLAPHRAILALALICMVIAAGSTALFAQLLQPIFDDVLINQKSDQILVIASIVFACITLRGLSSYGYIVLMNNIGHDIIAAVQKQLFSHILQADIRFFQENPSGALMTRLTSDTAIMRFAAAESLVGMVKAVLTLLALLGVMFYQNWQFSLVTLLVFPPAILFIAYLGKKIRKISRGAQEGVSDFSDRLSQIFQGIRQVRVHNREAFESERAGVLIDTVNKLLKKSVRIGNLTTPVNDLFIGIILFALISYGGFAVLGQEMTPGGLMTFIAAFLLAYEPLKKLSKLNAQLNAGLGAADRIFELLDRQPRIKDKKSAGTLDLKGPPEITFQDVRFSYDADLIIDSLSFSAPKGKVTALVGPSGGGKSTILNLIPRFFDPQSGEIQIGGKNIRDATLSSLRAKIAYVPQDPVIFDESVAYNIGYGREGASQEDIEQAAIMAFAHDFILDLPQKYETRLGEQGTKLSGGQKQRIAIARAILKNAPILLLDEATSALDNESEEFIHKSLEGLRKSKTCLVIAHRLSTIQNADKIIVIENGKIAEQGTHKKLLDKNGLYANLYNLSIKK